MCDNPYGDKSCRGCGWLLRPPLADHWCHLYQNRVEVAEEGICLRVPVCIWNQQLAEAELQDRPPDLKE